MGAVSPVVGTIVAGFPSPSEQYLEPPLDLNEFLIPHPPTTFFMRVVGNSMIGAGILEGDVLAVDRSQLAKDGDIIVASVNGDFTVKYFRKDSSGTRLEPANPAYSAIKIKPGQQFDYFGKVVCVVRKVS